LYLIVLHGVTWHKAGLASPRYAPGIVVSKLQIVVSKLGIVVLKLGIVVLKIEVVVSMLEIAVLKLGNVVSKLETVVLKLEIAASKLQIVVLKLGFVEIEQAGGAASTLAGTLSQCPNQFTSLPSAPIRTTSSSPAAAR
jgi:hypothetical protein